MNIVSLNVPSVAPGIESPSTVNPSVGFNERSSVLINTSRGPVIDEAALIKALQDKKIAGAGLDVFAEEPPKLDNPLLHMDNVVTTPHIGGFSIENVLLRVDFMYQNMDRVWRGKPPQNVVSGT